jgi:hypothetical protein
MTTTSPSPPKPLSLARYDGDTDTREHAGCLISVEWQQDQDMGAPWEERDCHGVVIDHYDEYANVLRLTPHRFGSNNWYYGLDASLEIARRDRWGLAPDVLDRLQFERGRSLADDEITRATVQADFECLRAWCHDEWVWLYAEATVSVRTSHGDCFLRVADGLSGIESTTAADCLDEIFVNATAWIDENRTCIEDIAYTFEQIEKLRATLTPCIR